MSWRSELRISCRQKIGDFPNHQTGEFVVFINELMQESETEDELRLLEYVLKKIEPKYINIAATPNMMNTIIYDIYFEIQKLFAQGYAWEISNQLIFNGVPNEDNYTI